MQKPASPLPFLSSVSSPGKFYWSIFSPQKLLAWSSRTPSSEILEKPFGGDHTPPSNSALFYFSPQLSTPTHTHTQVTSWEESHTTQGNHLNISCHFLREYSVIGVKWSENHDQGCFHCKWFIPVEIAQIFFLREISPAYLAPSLKNNIIIEKNREHHAD